MRFSHGLVALALSLPSCLVGAQPAANGTAPSNTTKPVAVSADTDLSLKAGECGVFAQGGNAQLTVCVRNVTALPANMQQVGQSRPRRRIEACIVLPRTPRAVPLSLLRDNENVDSLPQYVPQAMSNAGPFSLLVVALQVKGFVLNSGSVDLCDMTIKTVKAKGRVYDFWPDWANGGNYSKFFHPGQIEAAGITTDVRSQALVAVTRLSRDIQGKKNNQCVPVTTRVNYFRSMLMRADWPCRRVPTAPFRPWRWRPSATARLPRRPT
jgi:hypothetical protein